MSLKTSQGKLHVNRLVTILMAMLTIGALLLSVACSPGAKPKELRNITLATNQATAAPDDARFWVARALGYYADEGLNVKILTISGSDSATALLLTGQADFTQSATMSAMAAVMRGAPIVAIYGPYTRNAFELIVLADSSYKSPADLRGKTIGVPSLGSALVPYVKAEARYAGLNPENDIKFVPVGFGGPSVAALQSGQMAAMGTINAQIFLFNQQGVKVRSIASNQFRALPVAHITTTKDMMTKDSKVAIGFARALAKARVFLEENPTAGLQLFYQETPERPPQATDMDYLKLWLDDTALTAWQKGKPGWMDPKNWELWQEMLLEAKIITDKKDISTYFTSEYIDEINKFDREKVLRQAREYKK